MSTHGIKASRRPCISRCQLGMLKLAQLLIKHGADVHARDQSQSTPLHLASSRRYAETAQLLIKHGADVHARDQSQSTPLHLRHARKLRMSTAGQPDAIRLQMLEAQLLIKHGADVHARDQSQSTPLHLAAAMLKLLRY
jgi:ankyrin repeat protein